MSIDWVPVLGAQRSVGEVGAHLNPPSDYDRSISGEVHRGIGQSEISIVVTLRDHYGGTTTVCSHVSMKLYAGSQAIVSIIVHASTRHYVKKEMTPG